MERNKLQNPSASLRSSRDDNSIWDVRFLLEIELSSRPERSVVEGSAFDLRLAELSHSGRATIVGS
jgi:hypothetical protein